MLKPQQSKQKKCTKRQGMQQSLEIQPALLGETVVTVVTVETVVTMETVVTVYVVTGRQ